MLLIDLQTALAKTWLAAAEASLQVTASMITTTMRELTRMAEIATRALPSGHPAKAALPAMSLLQMPFNFGRGAWPFAFPGTQAAPFATAAFSPLALFGPHWSNPWTSAATNAFWPFLGKPSSTPMLDSVAASYRSTGGHAAAMVLTPRDLAEATRYWMDLGEDWRRRLH